jgi:hypothetical protein
MAKQKIFRLKQSEIQTLLAHITKPKHHALIAKLRRVSKTSAKTLEDIARSDLRSTDNQFDHVWKGEYKEVTS